MNEMTWEMLEQALEEKKLEVLEDYKALEFIAREMHIIAQKYKDKEKQQYVKPDLHADEMNWYDNIAQRIAREVKNDGHEPVF